MLLLATQCESRTTGLKALAGLYVCGRKITESDLLTHTRDLSAIGYEQFVIQFRRALIEGQTGIVTRVPEQTAHPAVPNEDELRRTEPPEPCPFCPRS